MNQLSCMIATAMNQNEGWHKTGNIAQMYSALKCEEKLQNLILEAQFGRQYSSVSNSRPYAYIFFCKFFSPYMPY